jgi:hypothetical protein
VINALPTVSISATRTLICRASEASTLTASGAQSYSWTTGANSASIVVTSTINGNLLYSVTGADANGCKNTYSIIIHVMGCEGGVAENASLIKLKVFPNPNNGIFTISSDAPQQNNVEIKLVNLLGETVLTEKYNGESIRVDAKLAKGLYFVKLLSEGEEIGGAKIIVE